MSGNKVLIIEDEEDLRQLLVMDLKHAGYEVFAAGSGEEGIEIFKQNMPEVVVSDIRLPGMDGLAVLQKLIDLDKSVQVIMATAHGSMEIARESMKLGACSFIEKPFSRQELIFSVARAFDERNLKEEVTQLRDENQKQKGEDDFIGSTPQMRELSNLVTRISTSDAPTILLQGESGTGKNFVARMIHAKSKRTYRPFMEINCASLPETLIESELFGYEKGAFTDAKQTKRGLFEAARGGTIFLDEIGEMSIATQAKLLHTIESHFFRRVGGLEDIETDVRVIAASNINLKEAVHLKRFREDLYFRLQLIPITIPPLRERREDIAVLAQNFIERFNKEYHKTIQGISLEAMVLLKTYSWPGNVRELKNVIERIAILENDPIIKAESLPYEIRSGNYQAPTDSHIPDYRIPEQGMNLEEVERQFLVQALQKTAGNQSRAAKLLGITRHTLRYRMEKFGLGG